jgi:uncharacterized protein YmfQ (DUF2313 family)
MTVLFDKFKFAQRWFEDAYSDLLHDLFPDGFIWIFDRVNFVSYLQDMIESSVLLQDSTASDTTLQDTAYSSGGSGNIFRRFLSCFAAELSRFESNAWDVLNQTDPGVAVDFLLDWERVLGLPEECFADETLTVAERQEIAHNKLFSTGVIASESFYVNYAATMGFTVTVEEIPEDSSPRIMGVAIMGVEPMGGSGGYSILKITVVSGTGNINVLQCAIDRLKPAHVTIVWVI